MTFTVTVPHTGDSNADAYDVVVADTLPAGLTYEDSSLPPADVTVTGQDIEFRRAVLTEADGQWEFTYTARVDNDATVGVALDNDARLTWKSLDDATGDPARADR